LWRRQWSLAERVIDTHLLLAAERDDRERLAIASERARIARELHTLVADGVVAMIVSATAARTAIRDDEKSALTAIGTIEETGRRALARMRDILGVLRAPHSSPPVLPSPGLGQLHALVQELRDSGRNVNLSVEGDPGPVPAGVDLTAYRIIEAALAEVDPRQSRGLTIGLHFKDESIDVEMTGIGLSLSPQLRLAVLERAALCHGAVLPTSAGNGTPGLHVHLPFSVSEAAAL
jgi:signal transduction histidine kinase